MMYSLLLPVGTRAVTVPRSLAVLSTQVFLLFEEHHFKKKTRICAANLLSQT